MEGTQDLKDRYILWFLAIIYLVGVSGHLISFSTEIMIALTPVTLFITGAVVVYSSGMGKPLLTWLLVVYLFTLAVEIIGVKTGIVFGDYSYGEVLGPKILGVPIIIGLNWVLVILGASVLSERLTSSPLQAALLTGVLAVIFDILLEPVAVHLGYWSWAAGDIPLLNYITWFILSFISSLLYFWLGVKVSGQVPAYYFFIQFIFFAIINFTV